MTAAKKKRVTKKKATRGRKIEPMRNLEAPPFLRDYQQAVLDRLNNGIKRQLLIWHRRAGKDVTSLEVAGQQLQKRIGSYWHMFPKHAQARRALWTGIDAHSGEPFIDRAFGHRGVKKVYQTDMMLEFECGSTWQLLGSDNYDRHVGSNPCGVVFSEWALCDPRAWDYIRPILTENDGWAIFITTFRGRNHAYQMSRQLANNPHWHVEILTVDDTKRHDGSPVVTREDIEIERAAGMPEWLIRQEFYCDPSAPRSGSIYGRFLRF